MKHEVTASFEELINQATTTTDEYMYKAVKRIDERFGEGYAKEHPELVGQMVQAAAMDFASSSNLIAAQKIQSAISELGGAIYAIAESIELANIGNVEKNQHETR